MSDNNFRIAYEEKCQQLAWETLRTSEQGQLLRRISTWITDRYGCPAVHSHRGECCRIKLAIEELLSRPINVPRPPTPEEASKAVAEAGQIPMSQKEIDDAVSAATSRSPHP